MIKKAAGSAIIYVLLSIPVLLTLAAFVINLSISYTAIEQAKSFTRLLSLSALEQYYEVLGEINESGNNQNIVATISTQVKDRVNLIAKKNYFTGHKEKEFIDFAFSWDTSNAPRGGTLTPGTYYFENEDEIPGCTTTPCFIPADPAVLAGDIEAYNGINSFKLEANFIEGLSMKYLGSFLGDQVKDIHSCAYSTAVKRNIVFIVDISGSSAADTHLRKPVVEQMEDPETGRGGYFAYPLDQINQPIPNGENLANCYTTSGGSKFGESQYCDWQFIRNYDGTAWSNGKIYSGPPQSRPPSEQNKLKHYYNDFISGGNEFQSKITVTGPVNDGTYGELVDYEEADLHPDPNDFPNINLVGKDFFLDKYTNPEPLTSIFNALKVAISELKDREIPGDKAGYIFIERTLTWSRIVNLTEHIDYLWHVANNSSRDFNGTYAPIRRKYGIFPSGLNSEDYTDLYVAIKEAVKQLKENKESLNGAPSLDSIVYIGDFLPNCIAKRNTSGSNVACTACTNLCQSCVPNDNNCLSQCNTCTIDCDSRECQDDYEYFNSALTEIWQLASEELIPNQITFNVVHLGKDVGPHTMDIEHPDPAQNGRCITDDEARSSMFDYVKGGNKQGLQPQNKDLYYKARSGEAPFYQAGYEAYKIVRATGGLFKPVLQKPWNCLPDDTCIDGFRREVDRECRSQQDQLSGFLTDIVGTGSPFKIVSTDCEFSDPIPTGQTGNGYPGGY